MDSFFSQPSTSSFAYFADTDGSDMESRQPGFQQQQFQDERQNSFQQEEDRSSSDSEASELLNNLCDNYRTNFLSNNLVMFPASKTKIMDAITMTEGLTVRHRLTKEAHTDILKTIKKIAGPQFDNLRVNRYQMEKLYDPPLDKIYYTFFCPLCEVDLLGPVTASSFKTCNKQCVECEKSYDLSTSKSNLFVMLDIEFVLNLILPREDIFYELIKALEFIKNRMNEPITKICDVYDGERYRNLYRSNCHKKGSMLTFNFSADGASPNESGDLVVWPLHMIMNELPPKLRFANVVLVGLLLTKGEPSIKLLNLFFRDFVDQMNALMNRTLTIKSFDSDQKLTFYLVPLCCCLDGQARPKVGNRISPSGYYACCWCYIHGTKSNKDAVRFPMLGNEQNIRERTHEEFVRDANEAQLLSESDPRFSNLRGSKGIAAIQFLKLFDCVWGICIDYMHGACLGVGKYFWTDIWTYSKKHKGQFYYLTKKERSQINKRICQFTPSHALHRLTRDMTHAADLKASEWRSWILYYSYPCLKGILDDRALNSYMLFVNSLYCLLQSEIPLEQLDKCEKDLMQCAGEAEIMYGNVVCTSNLHILSHYVKQVRLNGPMCMDSTFCFESAIFDYVRDITGSKGIYDQIIERYLRRLILKIRINDDRVSESARNFTSELFEHRLVVNCFQDKDNNVTLIGKGEEVNKYKDRPNDLVKFYDRCIYKKVNYHSTKYTRPQKTDDTFVMLHTSEIVRITGFYAKNESNIFLSGHKVIACEIQVTDDLKISYMLQVLDMLPFVERTYTFESIKHKLEYISFVENNSNMQYLCIPPNNFEIQ